MSPFWMKRLLRRPVLLGVNLLFCLCSCSLLCYLFGYLDGQHREVERIQDSFDILCVVSNIQGSSTTGLRIRPFYLQVLGDPSVEEGAAAYVRDLQMTKEFYATLAEAGKAETGQTQDLQVLALTNPELEPALDEAMGAPVLWLTQNTFYTSVEPVCVVSKTMYQQMAEADQSELTLRLQDPLSPEAGAVEVKLTVAGVHGGDTSAVYLPWGYAQRLMEDRFQSLSCDSLQFYVKDNRQLQTLHDRVQRWFQPVDIQGGDTLYSYALTIYDQQYWSTLAALQQNIRRSQYTIPILLVLVILAGALISFLAVRSARRSYALMRIQGLSRAGLLTTILAELLCPTLVGCGLASLLWKQWLPLMLFLACDLVGGAVAAIRPVLARPAMILRQQEG